jgi:hypothetical protein
VDKLAAVLQRALRIDQSTATFYVQQAGCNVRAAIEKVRHAAGSAVTAQLAALRPLPFCLPEEAQQLAARCPPVLVQYEEDKRWEKVMQRRRSSLLR